VNVVSLENKRPRVLCVANTTLQLPRSCPVETKQPLVLGMLPPANRIELGARVSFPSVSQKSILLPTGNSIEFINIHNLHKRAAAGGATGSFLFSNSLVSVPRDQLAFVRNTRLNDGASNCIHSAIDLHVRKLPLLQAHHESRSHQQKNAVTLTPVSADKREGYLKVSQHCRHRFVGVGNVSANDTRRASLRPPRTIQPLHCESS